jgi:hypothetical protein
MGWKVHNKSGDVYSGAPESKTRTSPTTKRCIRVVQATNNTAIAKGAVIHEHRPNKSNSEEDTDRRCRRYLFAAAATALLAAFNPKSIYVFSKSRSVF